jgi:1,4-alpha-glucan branching enzyme
MVELANCYPEASGLRRRALNQSARELMLAQSSDWAFIMSTGTMVDYAVKRTKTHLQNFLKLYDEIKNNYINEDGLKALEDKNNLFQSIDYSLYRRNA